MTIPQIIQAHHVEDHRLHIAFADGVAGEIDLQDELWGPVFEPLKDVARFRRFELNRELNTITWDTGADFAPEFLYEAVKQRQSAA